MNIGLELSAVAIATVTIGSAVGSKNRIAVRETELDRRDLRVDQVPLRAMHDRVCFHYLPELAAQGLIEYDRLQKSVTLAVSAADLDLVDGRDLVADDIEDKQTITADGTIEPELELDETTSSAD